MKVNIAEQIALYEGKKKAAEDGRDEIISKSVEEGRTLDETEKEAHKNFVNDIDKIDEHIKLLKGHEAVLQSKAVPIDDQSGRGDGGRQSQEQVLTVRSNLPKGLAYTRYAIAMAVAKGNVMHAHEIAKERYKDTPQVINSLKAGISLGGTREVSWQAKTAVAAGLTSHSSWAGPLVQYNDMENEFIDLLRPATIIGKMTRLHRVPFMSRMVRQLTGASGSFVGEGAPKPVNRQTYENVTLTFAKAAVIVVVSDELSRFSTPNAELLAQNDMIKGISEYLDKRFMDPSFPGVANVSPASITNGATKVQPSGTSLAAIDADTRSMMAPFTSSNVNPETAVWVMSPAMALKLSMKRTGQDEYAFPGITMTGGTWQGLPVITSTAMVSSGSPSESQIALVTQDEVLMADDGGVAIDMSTEASIQMDDDPSAGPQSLVSLWQQNLIGIRAERYITWAPKRANNLGILLLENTNY